MEQIIRVISIVHEEQSPCSGSRMGLHRSFRDSGQAFALCIRLLCRKWRMRNGKALTTWGSHHHTLLYQQPPHCWRQWSAPRWLPYQESVRGPSARGCVSSTCPSRTCRGPISLPLFMPFETWTRMTPFCVFMHQTRVRKRPPPWSRGVWLPWCEVASHLTNGGLSQGMSSYCFRTTQGVAAWEAFVEAVCASSAEIAGQHCEWVKSSSRSLCKRKRGDDSSVYGESLDLRRLELEMFRRVSSYGQKEMCLLGDSGGGDRPRVHSKGKAARSPPCTAQNLSHPPPE